MTYGTCTDELSGTYREVAETHVFRYEGTYIYTALQVDYMYVYWYLNASLIHYARKEWQLEFVAEDSALVVAYLANAILGRVRTLLARLTHHRTRLGW